MPWGDTPGSSKICLRAYLPAVILTKTMRRSCLFFIFTAALSAEMPHFSGVWKADLQKSKLGGGPPPTSYLVLIEQKSGVVNQRTKETAPEFIETSRTTSERGEQRSVLTAFEYAKPIVRPYDGIPTRLLGTSSGNTFTVAGEVAGTPDQFKRTYTLSPDGNTLTLTVAGTNGGHPMNSTVFMTKASEADAAAFHKPEELASVRFKNVKEDALKNLPASDFINQMHYFAWSLGEKCTFCHVEHKFDSDDKKEKKTARKMVEMAISINERNFEGHPAVRCFTCHEGHAHPLSRPMFGDEIAAAQKEHEEAEHNHPVPGGPPPPPHN
jgi:hypothetical protein